jgi:hypothetical protein
MRLCAGRLCAFDLSKLQTTYLSMLLTHQPAAAAADPQVGRTARGRDGRGRALLMLMPEELGFLKYLKQAKVRCQLTCLFVSL